MKINKNKYYHRLETGVKLHQEWRFQMHGQNPPLYQGRLQVIVLHDDVFLQDLDGVDLVGPLPLR